MTLRKGTLKDFDAATYTATVQLEGSLTVWLAGLVVARNIAASEMVVGRRCAVAFFSESDPQDGVVIAVYTA